MGCNDSKGMRKDFETSKFDKTTKGSCFQSKRKDINNDNFPQNSSGKISRLAPFYERLQDMYKSCNQNLKVFIAMIQERVSQIYIEISRQTLLEMNHDEIPAQQSKLIISQEILSLNLNILKVIGRNHNFEYDKETFKEINKFQNHLVGYLKTKYPRGQQTFVSSELMNNFKEFDRVNDLQYDILKNSNTYFGEPNDKSIIIGIKKFINKIIQQCDNHFPRFQKLMQQNAFLIFNEKNEKNEKKSLNYKIGRKISENVSKYQDLDSDFLEIFSPQIFRVLIKWMEDLEQTITKTSQKISKKQSFKCYVGDGEEPKSLDKNKQKSNQEKYQKKIQFDYINQYDYSEIVNSLIEKIEKLKPKLREKNEDFLNQLNNFNQTLLKILNQADTRQRYVPTKQLQTIKYSSFNAKFVEYILAEKLVYAIKQLIKVGKTFISSKMMNLDIVKFRITDLMRCQVSGNKKQIVQVYNNFKDLEKNQKIQIIKIKNRLSTPLNDAIIIFKITQSWIICEAQLILTDAGDKMDKKSKNIQLVNHYFYQLQRSPYGILAQIAVLITYKDSRISYENKITFNQSNVNIQHCKKDHKAQVIQTQKQQIPFICSKCSRFYRKSENLFKLYKCKKCKTMICSKCILKQNPELQASFIRRDIQRQLQLKIDLLSQSSEQKKQALKTQLSTSSSQIKRNKNDVTKKLTPKNILGIFMPERLKFKEKFDSYNYKKQGIQKVRVQKLMDQLNNMYNISKKSKIQYFMVVNFLKGFSNFKLYSYDPNDKQIQNTFDSRQYYDNESYFLYSEFDILLMMPPKQEYARSSSIKEKDNFVYLFVTKKQLLEKMNQVKALKDENKINKNQDYQIISKKLLDNNELVFDYRVPKKDVKQAVQKKYQYMDYDDYQQDQVQKKQFKYKSLDNLTKKFPDLKSARTTIEFDDYGIQTKHLIYFSNIDWFADIKQLKIAHNKIQDITIILNRLSNLQRFYFNDNYVTQLSFKKSLPNLQILNGTKNKINKIQGLNKIYKIKKLLLGSNQIKQFPQTNDLQVLNVLNLERNYLKDISSIQKSKFPQLHQLIINGQYSEYYQNSIESLETQSDDDDKSSWIPFRIPFGKDPDQMAIKIQNLKSFESQDNTEFLRGKTISFQSQKLQKISMNVCKIKKIQFLEDKCLTNLKYLFLNGNKIRKLQFLRIDKQYNSKQKSLFGSNVSNISNKTDGKIKPIYNENLIQLKLNGNQIQQLPILKFSSLQILQLSANKIKNIDSLIKSKMPELQQLDLSQNRFTDVCTLNFNQLINLNLAKNSQLKNINTLFSDKSQLPMLQKLSFSRSNIIDFNFNVNSQTNSMKKLQQIIFEQNMEFSQANTNKDSKQNIFEIPSLQKLTFEDCKIINFPILKLPKINQLRLSKLEAYNFFNIQKSQLQSLSSLYLHKIKQINNQKSRISGEDQSSKPDKIKKPKNEIGKFISCDFKFSQLKYLYIGYSTIGSLKGLQKNNYQNLVTLQLIEIITKDGKIPKIKAKNLTRIQLKGFKLYNADSFIGTNFPQLTQLILQENQIQTISNYVLSNLKKIKTLSLKQNKLQSFKCSTELDKLISLNLDNNNLKSFPIVKAKNLSEFTWNGNEFTDLDDLKICQLSAIDQIDIYNYDLSKTKGKIKGEFPQLKMVNLQKLRISNCKLRDLNNLIKSNLPSLRQLDLSFNEITSLPVLVLPRLAVLNIQSNKITDLNSLKQSKLQFLQELKISHNDIKQISSQLQLSRLKIFTCEHVPIKQLPQLDFSELQQINIQYCQLANIREFCKGDYKFLTHLIMTNNKIDYLPSVYMQSLVNVCFDNNQIQDLEQFMNDSTISQEFYWLSFEQNRIRRVPSFRLNKLQAVFFRGNPLTQLNCFEQKQYPELEGLYLKDTSITQLRNIKKFPKLKYLQLKNTKLQNIDWLVNAASNLPQLNTLDIRYCNITQVPNMDAFKQLKVLALQGNPIKYVSDLIQSDIFKNLTYVTIDLDVGNKFQKMRMKIQDKNIQCVVNQYKKGQKKQVNNTESSIVRSETYSE